jgi:DNA-binding protein H-NS
MRFNTLSISQLEILQLSIIILLEQMHKLEEQERNRRAAEEAAEAEAAKHAEESESKSGRCKKIVLKLSSYRDIDRGRAS